MSSTRQRYGEALDLFGEGRLEEAARAIEAILLLEPDFFDAYEGLAMTYSRMGDLDRAIGLMDELAAKDPDNIMAHTNLSVFYMKKGMKEKAEEEKAKAVVLQFARNARKGKAA